MLFELIYLVCAFTFCKSRVTRADPQLQVFSVCCRVLLCPQHLRLPSTPWPRVLRRCLHAARCSLGEKDNEREVCLKWIFPPSANQSMMSLKAAVFFPPLCILQWIFSQATVAREGWATAPGLSEGRQTSLPPLNTFEHFFLCTAGPCPVLQPDHPLLLVDQTHSAWSPHRHGQDEIPFKDTARRISICLGMKSGDEKLPKNQPAQQMNDCILFFLCF